MLEEANSLLRRRASEDPATGLANRGHFIAGLERELRRARRDGVGLSVLAVEVEAFSLLGELYGHDPAEETVCKVAETLRCVMRRPGDIGGRLSGGVLGLMLPATVTGGAAEVASRLVEGVDELRLEHAGVPGGLLSVKIGVVYSLPNSGSAELVNAAEQAARKSRQPDRGEP